MSLRGQMFRSNRQMPDDAARTFLAAQRTIHVGTVDAEGWPYVVPLAFIYEGTNELWFHTGWHEGHLFANLKHSPKLCLSVSQIGGLTPVKEGGFACDSSLINGSVIVFGKAEVIDDQAKKTWFFDRMVEKYSDPSLSFKPGYPMIDRIILFRMEIEILTGKHNEGMAH